MWHCHLTPPDAARKSSLCDCRPTDSTKLYATRGNNSIAIFYLYCPTHAVSNPIIRTSTVQGHPGSKFIVPIESPLMVCYLTSFKSNLVSVTIFEIFTVKIPDLDLGTVKGHPKSKFMVPIGIAHGGFLFDFY